MKARELISALGEDVSSLLLPGFHQDFKTSRAL